MATPLLWTTHRPQLAPLAARVVHQRRPHLRQPATVALPAFPLVGVCVRGPRRRLLPLHAHRQAQRRSYFCGLGRGRRDCLLALHQIDQSRVSTLSRLRLLAHQPQFLPNALRHPSHYFVLRLRLVSLGPGPDGIQPHHPARQNFAARLLGAHRIRLRMASPSCLSTNAASFKPPRSDRHLSRHAGAFAAAHELEKPPREGAKTRHRAVASLRTRIFGRELNSTAALV